MCFYVDQKFGVRFVSGPALFRNLPGQMCRKGDVELPSTNICQRHLRTFGSADSFPVGMAFQSYAYDLSSSIGGFVSLRSKYCQRPLELQKLLPSKRRDVKDDGQVVGSRKSTGDCFSK